MRLLYTTSSSAMLNPKNVRLVVAALMLFSIFGYFVFSANSLSHPSAARVKVPLTSDHALKEGGESPFNPANEKPSDDIPLGKPSDIVEALPENIASKVGFDDKKPGDEPSDQKTSGAGAGSEKNASGECNKVDYVVMVDAGSTGSRVHVYLFDTCVSPPALLKEEFKMLKPGLSSFDTDTKGAAASLDPLLDFALQFVPKEKQACTPVAVKATAGLRLLGTEKSQAILKEVRNHLESDYPFAVVAGDGVSIMEGKDEGVYAWITANYLLGNIGSKEKTPTAAVFDLGGGSTQIVFEPEIANSGKMIEGDHKYEFSFGDRDFVLYQYSHLGYGLMQGRNKVNALVVKSSNDESLQKFLSKDLAKEASGSARLLNPCLAPGAELNDVLVDAGDLEFYKVNFKGPAEASGAQCRQLAEKVLNMDTECTSNSCSFNGVYQPSLQKAFHQNSDMYVFSYFYDRTNPLGFPSSFTVEELKDLTKTVCAGLNFWKNVLLGDSIKQLEEEPNWCLDLSFITAMLHTGYNIPLSRELKTAKTIANNELGWCLGASLPLLNGKESGWKCRVTEATSN